MYDLVLHKNLNLEKWSKYSFDRQILMIANELNRYMNGVKSGLDYAAMQECLERIFELSDITIACQKGGRRHELLRWREMMGAYYLQASDYEDIPLELSMFARILLQSTRSTEALL